MKIIMPCWIINEELLQLTQNAVESLRASGDVELIIIDNGSPMGGGQLREWADLYIRNKTNLGYAEATNQGLLLCKYDKWVAVANNDIRVSPNWQEVIGKVDSKVGSIHFRMIPYTQSFSPGNDTWVGGKERWCTSSFFVVRSDVQLYDERFKNSYDDWDFWKRMRDSGYKQVYTNKAEYQHADSSTQQYIPQRNENDKKNREYFKQKHGGYPEDLFEKEFTGELAKPWHPFP